MGETIVELKLSKNPLYMELLNREKENKSITEVLTLIKDVGQDAVDLSKSIIESMPEFTLHDESHIFNMLNLACKIIPAEVIKKLSNPDIMMIILSIFLHDIGMSPERDLIKAWKNQLTNDDILPFSEEIIIFKRFRSGYVRELQEIEGFNKAGEYSKAQLLEDKIITYWIRETHADRARKLIAKKWDGKIRYKSMDLIHDLAEICFSHNESYITLLEMETDKLCGEDEFLCLTFVAVILRLTDIIDFDAKRTPEILFSHLTINDAVSLKEWLKHLSISAWVFKQDFILFSAQCVHPAIEASILKFCDLIDNELKNATTILANIHSEIYDTKCYNIKLPAYVNRKKIGAKIDMATNLPLYTYQDTKFTLNKRQVIDLLMGTKLYGKPDVALRELLQNSIDACKLRSSLCEAWKIIYEPHIRVSLRTENGMDYLIVEDNGMGMNQYILDNYYTNIGKSYYTSNDFHSLMSETRKKFSPISRFGIGVLACFMVCDNMEVETKRVIDAYNTDKSLKISIEGYDSLFVIKTGKRCAPGTKTSLKMRKVNPWRCMNKQEFTDCVKKILPLPPFDIEIEYDDSIEKISASDFDKLDIVDDKYLFWDNEENIKIISFNLDNEKSGFRGKAEIACIINQHEEIIKALDIGNKEVIVEDATFKLSSSLRYSENCIEKASNSLVLNSSGNIDSSISSSRICHSSSAISLKGINIPCSMFANYTNYGEKAVLNFPLPLRFRINIGSGSDLSINSARTKILHDAIWSKFELNFIEIILNKLKENVSNKEWSAIVEILNEHKARTFFNEILANI